MQNPAPNEEPTERQPLSTNERLSELTGLPASYLEEMTRGEIRKALSDASGEATN